MLKKTFNVNNTLYPEEILLEARTIFSDFAIEILPGSIQINEEDPQRVFDEFMNYSLSLLLEKNL